MLSRLTIKNFALIKDATVIFRPGFTAITGETGSGKSLLVSAISFLAGGKAPPGVVRDGASSTIVEAEFTSATGQSDIVRRELNDRGRSRSFVNDSPTKASTLTQFTSTLIDITSQRAFSHLLDQDKQLDFLDIFADTDKFREDLRSFERAYTGLERKLSGLKKQRNEFNQRQDLLRFQLQEIEDVDPQPNEDEVIGNEIRRLENFEDFQSASLQLSELMSEGEQAVESLLSQAEPLLERLSNYDSEISPYLSDFKSARSVLKEITLTLTQKSRASQFDADELERLRERQYQIAGLAKKFGGSLAAAIESHQRLTLELTAGEEYSVEIDRLSAERDQTVERWCKLAEKVSRRRQSSAVKLEKIVVKSLSKLGVPKARIEVRLVKTPTDNGLYLNNDIRYKLTGDGLEKAEFFFSANPGMETRPLSQVASGGELSRLMLALKEALPLTSNEATIIFDEIDTGVSGRVAEMVGLKLRDLSENRQLISITHLPQIAGVAENHLRVVKRTLGGITETEIEELDAEGRIREIGKLLSGDNLTDAALEQAENLFANGSAKS